MKLLPGASGIDVIRAVRRPGLERKKPEMIWIWNRVSRYMDFDFQTWRAGLVYVVENEAREPEEDKSDQQVKQRDNSKVEIRIMRYLWFQKLQYSNREKYGHYLITKLNQENIKDQKIYLVKNPFLFWSIGNGI